MSASKARTHVSVRMEPDLLVRVDKLIPHYSSPWHTATRSDVIRALLIDGLPAAEKTAKAVKKKGPR